MRRVWIDTMHVAGDLVSGTGVLRATAPAKLVGYYARSTPQVSAMDDATDQEHADVQTGVVVERRHDGQWRLSDLAAADPDGKPFEALKVILKAEADAFQAELDAFNPWGRHGSFYDDVDGWHITGVVIP